MRTVPDSIIINGRDFSCWTVMNFVMKDFHYERLRFWWSTVEIFIMKGWDLHDQQWDFHDQQSKFWLWTINSEIFMINKSKFSLWTVEIFMIPKSRFSFYLFYLFSIYLTLTKQYFWHLEMRLAFYEE